MTVRIPWLLVRFVVSGLSVAVLAVVLYAATDLMRLSWQPGFLIGWLAHAFWVWSAKWGKGV